MQESERDKARSAGLEAIVLLEPKLEGCGSLAEAFRLRRTVREFSDEALPPQMLSDLLWADPDLAAHRLDQPDARESLGLFAVDADDRRHYSAPHVPAHSGWGRGRDARTGGLRTDARTPGYCLTTSTEHCAWRTIVFAFEPSR